jgi:chromosome partitioning protein
MTVVSFASSKGGAGKTTSAIVLATTLARKYSISLIDTDPAHRLASWASKAKLPERMEVHVSLGERYIHDEIESARRRADFVICDLEGAATRLNAYAMGESDLVIVPMGDEQPDAEGAIETLAQLALEARNMRREIPVRILFCRTQVAVKSRLEKSLNTQVRDKIGSFTTELNKRTAFSSMHSLGGSLYEMNPAEVNGIDKAIANAEQFAAEVLTVIDWISTNKANRPQTPFQKSAAKPEVNHVR